MIKLPNGDHGNDCNDCNTKIINIILILWLWLSLNKWEGSHHYLRICFHVPSPEEQIL